MENNVMLTSEKEFTRLLRIKGITSWNEALYFLRKLPYGRNSNREILSLVITEEKGSCSSKHAMLRQLAQENSIPHVKLMLMIYRMTEANTPGISSVLSNHKLSYIPEAHCYIRYNDVAIDVTSEKSDARKLQSELLSEIEITPHQVSKFKVAYHQNYIKRWIASEEKHPYSFQRVWDIREECIMQLTN